MKTIREIRAERLYNSLNVQVDRIFGKLFAIKESFINNEISAKRAKKQYFALIERAKILDKRYVNIENITGIVRPCALNVYKSYVDFFEN